MFRFEVGANILLKKIGEGGVVIEVEILAKAPWRIKALMEDDGWFRRHSIHWLSDDEWITLGRVKKQ